MSKEIEAKVLAAVLGDRFLLTKVVNDGFGPNHFRDQSHRVLFKTAYDMSQIPGQIVDWVTLENTIKRRDWLTPEIAQALARLKKAETIEADQLMAYVEILKDESLREGMRKLAQTMMEYCERGGEQPERRISGFQQSHHSGSHRFSKTKGQKARRSAQGNHRRDPGPDQPTQNFG